MHVLGDLVHLVESHELHVGELKEHLNGVDIESALTCAGAGLSKRGIGHQYDRRMATRPAFEPLQLTGAAREHKLWRKP